MKPQKNVLLGMSGGVDSSVAALLLQKQGYKVIGAFLKLYSDSKNKLTGECSYVEERRMALKIAARLNIPLITLDYENDYKKRVIDPMFASYAHNTTPNPDISCNALIKFPLLWKTAQKHKADFIATGHYARIKKTEEEFHLLAGIDKEKDQSYFLADLSQADLKHTLFPLGNLTKNEIREIAKKNSFPNWNKLGTRGICFVGKTDMQQFLKQRIKEKLGKVISPEGIFLGVHRGTAFYTIGQKVGEHIGISIKKPHGLESARWYVAEKRGNTLVIAPEGHPALKGKSVSLIRFHQINPHQSLPRKLKARIRHRGLLLPGTLTKKDTHYEFKFSKPQESLAPGQILVLYKGREVVGCGEITAER